MPCGTSIPRNDGARAWSKTIGDSRYLHWKASLAGVAYVQPYLEMDAKFHQIIHEAQGNQILKDMLDKLYNQCMRLWNTIGDQALMADLIKSSIRDIKKVYQAFLNNDSAEVERLVKAHFESYLHTLISHLVGSTGNGIVSRGT